MFVIRHLRTLALSLVLMSASQLYAAESQSRLNGKQLVDVHCTRCHMAPQPSDLPKETWPIVLAWMGNYLGIINNDKRIRQDRIVRRDIPPEPLLSPKDFEILKNYILSNASTQAEMLIKRDILPGIKGFAVLDPNIGLNTKDMAFSLAIDEEKNLLYVGTVGANNGLKAFDLTSSKEIGSTLFESVPIHIKPMPTGVRVVTMGGRMENTNNGQVIDIEGIGTASQRSRMLINGLNRATEAKWADLNGDSLDDLVVSAFGNLPDAIDPKGRVSVFWQTPDYKKLWQTAPSQIAVGPLSGALRETNLINAVGNLDTIVSDFDKDGRKDILILKANARQQLILFINKGKEEFERRVIAEYVASHGHLSFSSADFNNDGYTDLLVSNGNNQELEKNKPTRPYHGIRILENNGDFTFTERFFFPMYGSTWSRALDFDGDGDLDIAGTSYFPSSLGDRNSETFVYLENKGDYQFSASTLADEHYGRWISMAVGDVNHDKKPDIILGLALDFFAGISEKWKNRSEPGVGDSPEDYMKSAGNKHKFTPVLYLINEHDY